MKFPYAKLIVIYTYGREDGHETQIYVVRTGTQAQEVLDGNVENVLCHAYSEEAADRIVAAMNAGDAN